MTPSGRKRKPKPKRIKIVPNLYKRGDTYIYRLGDFEEPLGNFRSDEKAIEAKELYERQRDRLGSESFEWRVKHLFPEYKATRKKQLVGALEGRRRISPRTFEEIERIWDGHLKKFFANRKLSEIDAVLWNQYCKRAAVSDLTNHRKVFGGFLRWCEAEGKVRFVPTMKIPAVDRRKRKRIPPEHLRLIVQHATRGGLLFICQYLFMLMRRGEQVRAEWAHYNFEENWVLIPDENTRTRTGRVVPLNPYVKTMLLKRLEEQRAAGTISKYIFPSPHNPKRHMTESGIGRFWRTTLKNANLLEFGYEPHDLRATGEHETSKDTRYTDTQREKFAGASMLTQKRIYLQGYMADDLRGLEESVQIEGISELIDTMLQNASHKSTTQEASTGETRGAAESDDGGDDVSS
jgi:hypothetical protein